MLQLPTELRDHVARHAKKARERDHRNRLRADRRPSDRTIQAFEEEENHEACVILTVAYWLDRL